MLDRIIDHYKDKKLNKLEDRIIAQLKFAAKLSMEDNGRYDSIVSDTESYLLDYIGNVGAITHEAVKQAEGMLSPLASAAKEYQVLCVAHAHIDMNWMWGYEETVATTVDTFRTMLDIMDEYDQFKFSQSQASVYRIIEEYYPDMLEQIKRRVKEGRWELTASTWVETDKNMPNGESLSRHILYTKDYLSRLFGISKDDLLIDFEPDTFGHNKNVPEILAKGGVKYYYHCRGTTDKTTLYRYQSESGNSIIAYREPYWYNAEITSDMVLLTPEVARETGCKTTLKLYGVGNHGGGPTRRDINRIIEYSGYPIFPTIKFSTLLEYFKAIDYLKDTLPRVDSEVNFLCDGCYTTQTIIKAGNRRSEALLYNSEAIATFAGMGDGYSYPVESFSNAWKKVLFNQFHDIIPGSGIAATREYASGLYQEVIAAAQTNEKIAVKSITDSINTSKLFGNTFDCIGDNIDDSIGEGAGVGYGFYGATAGLTRGFTVFNNTQYKRTTLTRLSIWDYEGDINRITVYNDAGDVLPHQLVGNNFNYWGHNCDTVMVEVAVPPFSYTTIVVKQDVSPKIEGIYLGWERAQFAEELVLENDLIRVEFDKLNGGIISFIDKASGEEQICGDITNVGVFRISDEAIKKNIGNSGMSAWFMGRYKNIQTISNYEMKQVENGELVKSLAFSTTFRSSKLTVTVSLAKGSRDINYKVECEFKEFGLDTTSVPNLHYHLPLSYSCDSYKYDVPFGVIDRKEMDIDNPGNSFIMGENNNGASFIIKTKTKYGFRGFSNEMYLTLIRASFEPDFAPDIRQHEIEFSVGIVDKDTQNSALIKDSVLYNQPLSVVNVKNHEGKNETTDSFIEIDGEVIVSSIKRSEQDKNRIILRIYEPNGKEVSVTIKPKFNLTKGYITDLNEDKELASGIISQNTATFTIKPYNMETICIY